MGIVHHGGQVVSAAQEIEPAGNRAERAHLDQHLLGLGTQQDGGGIDRQQVVGIVGADETGPDLRSVEAHQHSLEAFLDDLAAEVRHPLAGVGTHLGAGVLHHDLAVAVVEVGQGEGRLRQLVEETLLAVAVGGESLVVVQVVAWNSRPAIRSWSTEWELTSMKQ